MTSAFLDALHAEGPAADRADKMALYGQFVGAWDLDVTEFKDDGTTRQRPGEWHFGWALEGRAIQDVWIVPPRGQRNGDAVAHASRGTAYFDRRDFAHAIADYDMAIAIDPSVAMYISDRGNTRLQMGEKEAAIADFSRAIEVDPNYAAAYIRRGRAFLASDELERAEADFAKALQLAPGDSEAQSGRTAVLERRNPAQAAAEKDAEHRAGFERLRSLVDQQHGKSAP
jgi:tetratricopeptide (TPR) repeat protein